MKHSKHNIIISHFTVIWLYFITHLVIEKIYLQEIPINGLFPGCLNAFLNS
jgi:hypothetical protein